MFKIRPPKLTKFAKIAKVAKMLKEEALRHLRSILHKEEALCVEWLTSTWNNQIEAVRYSDLREVILNWGDLSSNLLSRWQEDYSMLVNNQLAPSWIRTMMDAAEEKRKLVPKLLFDPQSVAVQNFVRENSAKLVTNLVNSQQQALRNMVARAADIEGMTVNRLARIMRPVIGLTTPQINANLRYWESVWRSGVEAGLSSAAAERRANEKAANYAARQHRYRAESIAQTELATAYNEGAFGAVDEARRQGYIGDTIKRWLTADDDRVCPICGPLDGKTANMNAPFPNGIMLPPAHPRCRCAVAFEEITENLTPNTQPLF